MYPEKNDIPDQEFLDQLELNQQQLLIGGQILKEIQARTKFLLDVGLDYLTLSRATGSLSGALHIFNQAFKRHVINSLASLPFIVNLYFLPVSSVEYNILNLFGIFPEWRVQREIIQGL